MGVPSDRTPAQSPSWSTFVVILFVEGRREQKGLQQGVTFEGRPGPTHHPGGQTEDTFHLPNLANFGPSARSPPHFPPVTKAGPGFC